MALLLALGFSAACLILSAMLRTSPPYIRYWAMGGVSIAMGLLLIVLREALPPELSILLANLAIVAGYAVLSAGTSMFRGRAIRRDVGLGLGFAAGFAALYFGGAALDLRVVLISVMMVVFAVLMIVRFLGGPPSLGSVMAVSTLSATTVLNLVRTITTLGLFELPEAAGGLHTTVIGLGVLGALGIALALTIVSLRQAFARPVVEAGAGEELLRWRLAQARCVLVTPSGVELRLTGNEYLLLQQLVDGNSPVDRRALNAVIGRDSHNPKDRGIDILISRLRRKCADAGVALPITSVRGRGYVFHGALQLI